MAEISSDRPNWSGVAKSNADGVRVIVDEIRKVDAPVNISPIVKNNSSEILHDRNGIADLRVEDEQLVASNRHRNLWTICGLPRRAKRHITDRASFIDGKAA